MSTTGAIALSSESAQDARLLYLASQDLNGVLGYVIDLGGPIPNGKSWTLTNLGGTGPISLAARFYKAIDGLGSPCAAMGTLDGSGGKTGSVTCAGGQARYAIVYAQTGPDSTDPSTVYASAMIRFRFTI